MIWLLFGGMTFVALGALLWPLWRARAAGDATGDLGVSIYKVGMPWPLEPTGIRSFAAGLETLMVVEHKRPLIETQARAALYDLPAHARPKIIGKVDEQGHALLSELGSLLPLLASLGALLGLLQLSFPPLLIAPTDAVADTGQPRGVLLASSELLLGHDLALTAAPHALADREAVLHSDAESLAVRTYRVAVQLHDDLVSRAAAPSLDSVIVHVPYYLVEVSASAVVDGHDRPPGVLHHSLVVPSVGASLAEGGVHPRLDEGSLLAHGTTGQTSTAR